MKFNLFTLYFLGLVIFIAIALNTKNQQNLERSIMIRLNPGDKCPNFNLKDQDGKTVKLSDFKDQKLLIYFYPKANTPGCTTQTCSVNENLKELEKLSVKAIGISPDAQESQKKFAEKYEIKFPLLCDTEHKTAESFGVWEEKTSFGKTSMGIIRSSFLVDEKGKIIKAWYKVSPNDTVPNALDALMK